MNGEAKAGQCSVLQRHGNELIRVAAGRHRMAGNGIVSGRKATARQGKAAKGDDRLRKRIEECRNGVEMRGIGVVTQGMDENGEGNVLIKTQRNSTVMICNGFVSQRAATIRKGGEQSRCATLGKGRARSSDAAATRPALININQH